MTEFERWVSKEALLLDDMSPIFSTKTIIQSAQRHGMALQELWKRMEQEKFSRDLSRRVGDTNVHCISCNIYPKDVMLTTSLAFRTTLQTYD